MDLKELNLEYQWLKERIAQSKSKLDNIKQVFLLILPM